MATPQTSARTVKDLVDSLPTRHYLFVEHELRSGDHGSWRSQIQDYRSFLVIAGQVRLEYFGEDGRERSKTYGHLQGWHAPPGAVFRFSVEAGGTPDAAEAVLLLEAGTVAGDVKQVDQAETARPGIAARPCADVDDYTVNKPWGHEVWYTQNLSEPGYALKQIHMTAGSQSSLQSHEHKTETNYVIDGEATVLNGALAPDDLAATIDTATLPRAVYRHRTGWSSAPRVLHRVIAQLDYTSVEVSTPELDDVIRWADDTGRKHGRIDAEHLGGPR
jgi:hypothetical protein